MLTTTNDVEDVTEGQGADPQVSSINGTKHFQVFCHWFFAVCVPVVGGGGGVACVRPN